MKTYYTGLLYLAFVLALLISCQRELSFENGTTSAGYLKKDGANNCLPVTTSGTFTAGAATGDSNMVQVDVVVTQPGSYILKSDTVNGFYFTATGNFAATGTQQVQLHAKGIPQTQGSTNFILRYDSSICEVNIMVGKNLSTPASYTLQGSPDTCLHAVIAGIFLKGSLTDSSDRVTVNLSVTNPGTYSISTTTVNGYHFAGAGTLPGTGLQTVTLLAAGTPVNAGTDVFTVSAGPSSCTFQLPVIIAVAVTNNDHFPITEASFWNYDHTYYPMDSVQRFITGTANKNGSVYKVMNETVPFTGVHPLYFRRAADEYYEYAKVDKYTNSFQYGAEIDADILFLKENLKKGDSWLSDEFTGVASFGQTIILPYQYFCADANAVVSVNGKTFSNVYKILMRPHIKSVGGPYGDTFEFLDFYYAKGVGLIYAKKVQNSFFQYEENLRSWRVN